MAPEAIKQPRPHSRVAGASGPAAAPPFHRLCLGMCSAVALHLFGECRRSVEELMNRCRGLSGVTTARVGTQCPAQFRCSICGGFAIRHRQDSDLQSSEHPTTTAPTYHKNQPDMISYRIKRIIYRIKEIHVLSLLLLTPLRFNY